MLIECTFLSYISNIIHAKGENQGLMTKTFKFSKKTFLITLFSLLLVACLIIANYLSLTLIKTNSSAESISSNEFNLYFLSLSKSKLESEANSIAADYRKIGAGGYIWQKDEYYHVVSSAYANKNDAELVQNSIKINQNLESEIFTIKFKSYTINGSFNGEEKKVIQKALGSCQAYYTSLYDIAISLDTGVYNEISAKLAVNNASQTLATTYANLNTLYPNTPSSPYNNISWLNEQAVKLSQKLSSGERISEGQTYSSLIKYRYIEILSLLYNFIN